jgi:hypothetical protein
MIRRRDRTGKRREFPRALLSEAANHPNGWVYEIRAGVDPIGAVPPEDIIGAWAVNADGQPTGEFSPNPKYQEP